MAIPATLEILGVPTEHTGFVAAGHLPLTITSDSTPDVNTGDTAVVTVTTSGSFGDIDFAIIGGTDAGAFTINDETGALSFRAASVDGTYDVIVRAFSDWGSATQEITVTVAAGGYTASAVHFTGPSTLGGNTFSANTNGLLALSTWVKFAGSGDPPVFIGEDVFVGGFMLFQQGGNGTCSILFFSPDYSSQFANDFGDNTIPINSWAHLLFAVDTNQAQGSKKIALYVNDVLQTPSQTTDLGIGFSNTFDNLFYINSTQYGGYVMDQSDLWLGPNIPILSGSTIPEATRRLFISAVGKPEDPSGWPASSAQFYGDSAAFATNRGSGGTFTLGSPLTNASTSPSD